VTAEDIQRFDGLLDDDERDAFDDKLIEGIRRFLLWLRHDIADGERHLKQGRERWERAQREEPSEDRKLRLRELDENIDIFARSVNDSRYARHDIVAILFEFALAADEEPQRRVLRAFETIDAVLWERRSRETIERDIANAKRKQPTANSSSVPQPAETFSASLITEHPEPKRPRRVTHRVRTPGLREAVEKVLRECGLPGSGGPPLKAFVARVCADCGVKATAPGYSERTIRRLLASLANSEK
jgi:hypothetical protein